VVRQRFSILWHGIDWPTSLGLHLVALHGWGCKAICSQSPAHVWGIRQIVVAGSGGQLAGKTGAVC
jgi:hypothetical protein